MRARDRRALEAAGGPGHERDRDQHEDAAGGDQRRLAQGLAGVLADPAEAAEAAEREARVLAGGVDHRQALGALDRLRERMAAPAAHPPRLASG
jgi:hypothetical protein